MIADGLPHVRLPAGSLPLHDDDVDNLRDPDSDVSFTNDSAVDKDIDTPIQQGPKFPDSDDTFALDLGRGASPTQARALSHLVLRYFSAARAGDGAMACSLLAANEAASLPRESSPPSQSCPAAAATLLQRDRHALAAPVKIVDVRLLDPYAEAIVGSRTLPASVVLLKRENGRWRFEGLFAQPLL